MICLPTSLSSQSDFGMQHYIFQKKCGNPLFYSHFFFFPPPSSFLQPKSVLPALPSLSPTAAAAVTANSAPLLERFLRLALLHGGAANVDFATQVAAVPALMAALSGGGDGGHANVPEPLVLRAGQLEGDLGACDPEVRSALERVGRGFPTGSPPNQYRYSVNLVMGCSKVFFFTIPTPTLAY